VFALKAVFLGERCSRFATACVTTDGKVTSYTQRNPIKLLSLSSPLLLTPPPFFTFLKLRAFSSAFSSSLLHYWCCSWCQHWL